MSARSFLEGFGKAIAWVIGLPLVLMFTIPAWGPFLAAYLFIGMLAADAVAPSNPTVFCWVMGGVTAILSLLTIWGFKASHSY